MWAIHYRPPSWNLFPSLVLVPLKNRHRPWPICRLATAPTHTQHHQTAFNHRPIHLRDITRISVPLMPPVIELSRLTPSAWKSQLRGHNINDGTSLLRRPAINSAVSNEKWRKYEELMRGGGSFQPYFLHADVMCFAECCYRAVWFFRDHKRWSDRCSITNIAHWYSPIDTIDARDWLSLHYQT